MTENENNRPSFDGLPQSVAELHAKIDRLTETVEKLAVAIGTKPQNELMTVEDVSAMLCKSVSTIYTMTSEHRIPYRKQGNKLYFIRKEITAWLMRAVVPKDSPKRRRKEDADKESPQEKPSEEPPCSIEHRIHSRTGADLFAVLFSAELEAAGERKFSQQAREHGGYWSDYGNGGYIFNAQADAERFAQAIIGKKEEPTDTQKEGLPTL